MHFWTVLLLHKNVIEFCMLMLFLATLAHFLINHKELYAYYLGFPSNFTCFKNVHRYFVTSPFKKWSLIVLHWAWTGLSDFQQIDKCGSDGTFWDLAVKDTETSSLPSVGLCLMIRSGGASCHVMRTHRQPWERSTWRRTEAPANSQVSEPTWVWIL